MVKMPTLLNAVFPVLELFDKVGEKQVQGTVLADLCLRLLNGEILIAALNGRSGQNQRLAIKQFSLVIFRLVIWRDRENAVGADLYLVTGIAAGEIAVFFAEREMHLTNNSAMLNGVET